MHSLKLLASCFLMIVAVFGCSQQYREPVPETQKAKGKVVQANGASNSASGFLSSATQQIGGAQGNGVLNNATVIATGSNNSASGFLSSASQSIGVAK